MPTTLQETFILLHCGIYFSIFHP